MVKNGKTLTFKVNFRLWCSLVARAYFLLFLTTFAQLSARLKNFLGGWLLVLGIKEGLVECATVCVKSGVILGHSTLLGRWAADPTGTRG